MNANAVRLALQAWDALTEPNDTAFNAKGLDGECYPRSRLLTAWSIDQAIDALHPMYQEAANELRYGGDKTGRRKQEQACDLIALLIRGTYE